MTNTIANELPLPLAQATRTLALVGNPNTGKTTLFNVLTGFRQRVANYPRVTVEMRTGMLRGIDASSPIELIDLPGAYSLAAEGEDEAVLLDVLLGNIPGTHEPDAIVFVADAANLTRNLFLATQLLELGKPLVVALNMMDVATRAGLDIDVDALAEELGVPVVPIIATKQSGIGQLRRAITQALDSQRCDRCPDFPECVCAELDGLCASLEGRSPGRLRRTSRVEALQTLLGPGGYHESRLLQRCGRGLAEELAERRARIAAAGESISEVEARVRYAWIYGVVQRVVTTGDRKRRSRTDLIDRMLTHPWLGLAALTLMMGVMFQAIYSWAGPLIDTIDSAFGSLGAWAGALIPEGALQSLLVSGVISGVGAVLVFLPQILLLFLFIAILEDCGYMARAAFLLDRWMSKLGLNGQAFIPLLSSFACAVPGIMATRTIDDKRDRFVTILIAPLMSCSARLPVYILLIGAFIPATPILGGLMNLQAATLLGMYVVGIVVAIPVAWSLKRFVFKGPPPSFLMELPTYKWPSAATVFHRAYEQGKAFVVSAGTIIFASAIVIWALGYYPRPARVGAAFEAKRAEVRASVQHASADATDGALEMRLSELDRAEAGAYLEASFLGQTGQWIEPLVRPLGWDWRIGTAVIASFPAREVIIATMGTIYNLGEDVDEGSTSLREKLHSATWPDGRPVFNLAVALSIMVFFALCCQCVSTLAVIQRETRTWRWPLITFAYMTSLAYVAALLTYRIALGLI